MSSVEGSDGTELAKLKAKNDQLREQLKESKTKKRKTEKLSPSELKANCSTSLKTIDWHSMNFVTDPNTELELAKLVILNADIQGHGAKNTDNVDSFVDLHSEVTMKMLNDQRSYVSNCLREVVMDYLEKNKKRMFDLDELAKIVKCKKDCDKQLFVWWWTKVLPVIVGRHQLWNERVHCCTTIEECTDKHGEVIAPLLEALACVLIDDNYVKWPKFHALKKANKGKQIKFAHKSDDGKGKDPESTDKAHLFCMTRVTNLIQSTVKQALVRRNIVGFREKDC